MWVLVEARFGRCAVSGGGLPHPIAPPDRPTRLPHPIAPPDRPTRLPQLPNARCQCPTPKPQPRPNLFSESVSVEGDELVGDSRRRMSAEASVGFEEQLTLSLVALLVALW